MTIPIKRIPEHYHRRMSFQVYGNGESVWAKTIHRARKNVVLEFPTVMFQIQNGIQNSLQGRGQLSNLCLRTF